jgi:hypothetical protein
MDKGTKTNLINMEKSNVVINEIVSMEEPPKVVTKDKATLKKGLKIKIKTLLLIKPY